MGATFQNTCKLKLLYYILESKSNTITSGQPLLEVREMLQTLPL